MNTLKTFNQEYANLIGDGQSLISLSLAQKINRVYQEELVMNKLNRMELENVLANEGMIFEGSDGVNSNLKDIHEDGFTLEIKGPGVHVVRHCNWDLERIFDTIYDRAGFNKKAASTIFKDNIMSRQELNKELSNRGIVYDADFEDEFEVCCYLEAIYDWGFTTITYYSEALDPVMTFYDWEYQAICNIDLDNYTEYTLDAGALHVKERKMFRENDYFEFNYDLNDGAPVHMQDMLAVWYDDGVDFPDSRFYELKDGRIFCLESGKGIRLSSLEDFDEDITYVSVPQDAIQDNINILNNALVWANIR